MFLETEKAKKYLDVIVKNIVDIVLGANNSLGSHPPEKPESYPIRMVALH